MSEMFIYTYNIKCINTLYTFFNYTLCNIYVLLTFVNPILKNCQHSEEIFLSVLKTFQYKVLKILNEMGFR